MPSTKRQPVTPATHEFSIDQWFERQNRAVDKVHRSLRLKRSRSRTAIDEVELGRRVAEQTAKEEKQFVDAVVLARALSRMDTATGNGNDLIRGKWSEAPRWFSDAYARHYEHAPSSFEVVPCRRAALKDHRQKVREEVEAAMRAELEAAGDREEIEELKDWVSKQDILNFAENLEVARIVYRRHRKLVIAESFPEPYRTVIASSSDYDPNEEDGVNINDGHITDPVEAECEREQKARESIVRRAAKSANQNAGVPI